jgi:hypothetical protein
VAQFQEVWVQNCLVTSCHFQASSHFRNQNTFNLQDWLALILYVGVWSTKYFCQNTLWKKHLLISKQQEDKGKTCFVQGWDVTPKQNAEWQKFHNNMIDSSTPFWDQLFWQYLCLPSNFDHSSFWGCSGDKMINDKLLHRFLSSFAHQFADSILAIIQLNGLKSPHDIQISCLDYIT